MSVGEKGERVGVCQEEEEARPHLALQAVSLLSEEVERGERLEVEVESGVGHPVLRHLQVTMGS